MDIIRKMDTELWQTSNLQVLTNNCPFVKYLKVMPLDSITNCLREITVCKEPFERLLSLFECHKNIVLEIKLSPFINYNVT